MYLAHRSATVKELAKVQFQSNIFLNKVVSEKMFSGDETAISVGAADAREHQVGGGEVLAPPSWCLKPYWHGHQLGS